MSMKLTLGISPCPNDTFIFDALINQKIDTGAIRFEPVLEDVQTLNEWALQGKLNLTKISYGVYPFITDHYTLLNSGGALGSGVGPLLVSKKEIDIKTNHQFSVALPGQNTTAHFLFTSLFPEANNKTFMVFHEIEEAVLSDKVDAGVIIHENRFTYKEKGLIKLMDLGEAWELKTQLPIPLGGIVAKRTLDPSIRNEVEQLIRKSVEYAFKNYPEVPEYTRRHAQEMSESVMRSHIELYVNKYTYDLGAEGQKAVDELLKAFKRNG